MRKSTDAEWRPAQLLVFVDMWDSCVNAAAAAMANRFCGVKEVRYIGAGPNPFGGRAARIHLTGFSKEDLTRMVQVIDIAY